MKNFKTFKEYIKTISDVPLRKISIDAGMSCPNRTGERGYGGCVFCNNNSFNPRLTPEYKSISQQIIEGIEQFSLKRPDQFYLAYFQSYSNTYDRVENLKLLYDEALQHPLVKGLVIGTRPDCLENEVLDLLESYAKDVHVFLEIGVESTHDKTLTLINRGHCYEEVVDAMNRAQSRGIHLTAHLILGLPGESRLEMMEHAYKISQLPINSLKVHQLQVVRNTILASEYLHNPDRYPVFDFNEYIEFMVEFVTQVRADIVIERMISTSPEHLLIEPKWKPISNANFMQIVDNKLTALNRVQGDVYLSQS